MGWGLESSLELEKHCALVLDIRPIGCVQENTYKQMTIELKEL